MFPSNWLKCTDLRNRTIKVTLDRVDQEKIGSDTKYVAYFVGKEKGLVLNKTNAQMIAEFHGEDTTSWHGKVIELRPDKTQYKGDVVDCIRVGGVDIPPVGSDNGGEVPF